MARNVRLRRVHPQRNVPVQAKKVARGRGEMEAEAVEVAGEDVMGGVIENEGESRRGWILWSKWHWRCQ